MNPATTTSTTSTAATATIEDRYPSRVRPEPSIVERVDPVVYGTAEDGPLTAEQLGAFDQDGFLQLPDVFTADEVQAMRDELARLSGLREVKDDERTVLEPSNDEVRSIFEVHRRELFADVAADERVVSVARQILGSGVYIHQSRVNFKPGFRGKDFYWHSDFETWHTEDGMPSPRAVSASISLTDNTEFNGPLMIIPGSHLLYVTCVGETPENHYRESLRAQEYGTPDDASLASLVDDAGGRIATLTGRAGGVVFFDSNAMHGSNSNISPLPRSNVFLVFNSTGNTLVDPFMAPAPRPTFIASRTFDPVGQP